VGKGKGQRRKGKGKKRKEVNVGKKQPQNELLVTALSTIVFTVARVSMEKYCRHCVTASG